MVAFVCCPSRTLDSAEGFFDRNVIILGLYCCPGLDTPEGVLVEENFTVYVQDEVEKVDDLLGRGGVVAVGEGDVLQELGPFFEKERCLI